LEELLKEMPHYLVKYVDDKLDIRSPLTLFNNVRDYKEFFQWLMAEEIVKSKSIKEIPVEALAPIPLDDANNYFKFIARKKYKVSKKDDETKQIDIRTVNRHKSSLKSLFKYLTVESEVKSGKPYFERNVMAKIPIKRVSETFNERGKKITDKIFIEDKDIEFLDYVQNEYESSLSPSQKRFFQRDSIQFRINLGARLYMERWA
jgi:hypothetical protein